MKKLCLMLLCGVLAMATHVPPAWAIKQFQDQFHAKYAGEKADASFVALVKKTAKCNVCHLGKKKKDRNAYGQELSKLLDKKADKKDVKKIREALDKVAKMHLDPEDEKSPTFGDLIKAGKLPGGEIK